MLARCPDMGIFTRDESELLSYDADAFFYFAATCLGVVLIPWTLAIAYGLAHPRCRPEDDFDGLGPAPNDVRVRFCRAGTLEAKRSEAMQNARSWRRRLGGFVRVQLAVVAVLWVCFSAVLWRLKDTPPELCSFDPYAILDISVGADERAIKKAYRLKSLQHHPDKDRVNPLAHVQFQQVAKAYAALTDEGARRNYAKYGNPDGPVQTKVGVALHPALLMNKETQRITLVVFFAVLFIVPFSVIFCWLRGARLSGNDVDGETLRVFETCIDSEVSLEDCPGLLGASVECRRMANSPQCRPLLWAMAAISPQPLAPGVVVEVRKDAGGPAEAFRGRHGVVRSHKDGSVVCAVQVSKDEVKELPCSALVTVEPKIACPFSDSVIRRSALLIWGHLWRQHAHMSPLTKLQLNDMLRRSVKISRAMVAIAGHGRGDRSGYFPVVKNLMRFRQCLVQAVDLTASPLLQIPHVPRGPAIEAADAPSFHDILAGGPVCERFLAKLGLNEQQVLDVHAFSKHVSRVSLSCRVEVLDEDMIAEGDLATLTVKLIRTNLQEGEAVGPVHAPFWPGPKFEEWWIVVYDDRARRLVTVEAVLGTRWQEEAQIQFMVPRSGIFHWTVYAMCDSYLDVDTSCTVCFRALKQCEVDRQYFIHPADAEIKTFFEELMEGMNPVDNDDSESEDEQPAKSAVAHAPATEEPASLQGRDPWSSDEEGSQDREGVFYRVTAQAGALLFREPAEEPHFHLGSIPGGSIVRGYEGDGPNRWIELAPGGAWMILDAPQAGSEQAMGGASKPITSTVPLANGGLVRLGRLMEQPLRTILQPHTPFRLIRRWARRSDATVGEQDMVGVLNIEDANMRSSIEELLRMRLGDASFETLRGNAEELLVARKKRMAKVLGVFSTPNGITWHVSLSGAVRGLKQDGTKVRDTIAVLDDAIRLGPFRLDETKTCSCIHWLRVDDPEKQWVWSRDQALRSRMRMGISW